MLSVDNLVWRVRSIRDEIPFNPCTVHSMYPTVFRPTPDEETLSDRHRKTIIKGHRNNIVIIDYLVNYDYKFYSASGDSHLCAGYRCGVPAGDQHRTPLEYGVHRSYTCSLRNGRGGRCCRLVYNYRSAFALH